MTGDAALTIRDLGREWDDQWDALAGRSPEPGFKQSSAWAAFKRAEGYDTPRYGLFEGHDLIGGASLLSYPAAEGEGFIICPEGPILPWDDRIRARQGLKLIVDRALRIARDRSA